MRRAIRHVLDHLLAAISWLLFPESPDEHTASVLNAEALVRLTNARRCGDAVALMPYRNERVRALIWQLKYKKDMRAAELCGHVLATHLAQEPGQWILIPMPLAPDRLRARGYNQVALVAEAAARIHAGLTVRTDILARTGTSDRQTTLTRPLRRRNVVDTFVAQGAATPHRIMLLDDVITTGSTMAAAKAALTQAGAVDVHCLALAH